MCKKREKMIHRILAGFVILGLSFQSFAASRAPQMTPRQAIYFYAHQANRPALQSLKKAGYPIDLSDKYGNSALCEAFLRKDQTAINTLIQEGADTNSYCMQALSVSYNEKVATGASYSNASSSGTNATSRSVLATKAETSIPNPPQEWSTDAKVFTGLGVAAALLGGGAIYALSQGGGGSKKTSCVMGTLTEKGVCVCDEGATGASCI